jgi:hypothetical protein
MRRIRGLLVSCLNCIRNRHLMLWDLLVQMMVILLAYTIRLDSFLPETLRRRS